MPPNKTQTTSSFQAYAMQTPEQVCIAFNTSATTGLSSEQVIKNRQQFGSNEISGHEITWIHILYNQIKSPFIYVLIVIAGIDFMLGELDDGIMILSIVIINTVFSFYQEFRTHKALQLLKQYIVDTVRVIRDGKALVLDTKQLVPGDSITLYPGDKIPADIRLVATDKVTIDESILTGESVPVEKNSTTIPEQEITIFTATNIGFSGSTIISGKATGIVFATGNSSYFGSIARFAQEGQKLTSFAVSIAQFSKFILYLILITVGCIFFVHLLWAHKLDLINLITFSMALGISIIPEALPIVITFSLARGALHLARYKVVAKRLSAIEDLGSMQLLCIDKTGTLTENKLIFTDIFGPDKQQTLTYSLLASGQPASQFARDQGFDGPLWRQLNSQEQDTIAHYTLIAEHPFEPLLRYSSVIVAADNAYELIVRGNVREVIALCTNAHELQAALSWADHEGEQGHRVLAIAKKEVDKNTTLTQENTQNLTFIGLVSYQDPVKPTAAVSLARARKLGVIVKIISGDTQDVNVAVARSIKLITSQDETISGEEFAQKSSAEKIEIVQRCAVFAHILPDQKVEIVRLLQGTYDTGYLGDGINDAPALKIAQVSLAVDTAADVAREESDIILLQKSLKVIVDGIHEGRIIFANIVKYIKSTLAANFGHFYSLSLVSLFIDFLPMLPSQLLLVSLLTDLPLIAISTDTVSFEDINKPRHYDLYDIALVSLLLGIIVMVADFIVFGSFYTGYPPAVLQTNWFITSILIELSFFYSIRTRLPFYKASFPSPYVLSLSIMVAATALMLPFTAFGQAFLHFTPPTKQHLLLISVIVVGYFVITDCTKIVFYRFYTKN